MKRHARIAIFIALFLCGFLGIASVQADEQPAVLTPQEAINLLGGPTIITLHLTDATPEQFYQELWKQAKLPPYNPTFVPANSEKPLVSIDANNVPFWKVVREFQQQTGYTVAEQYSTPFRTYLSPSSITAWSGGSAVFSGPFVFMVNKVTHAEQRSVRYSFDKVSYNSGDQLYLSLYGLIDPKLTIFQDPKKTKLVIEEAVTDKGTSLIGGIPKIVDLNGGPSHGFGQGIMLTPQKTDGGHIATLKGYLQALFPTQWDTWEIPDIANAAGTVRGTLPQASDVKALSSGDVAQYEITKVDEIKDGYEVSLKFLYSWDIVDSQNMMEALVQGLHAVDDAGNEVYISYKKDEVVPERNDPLRQFLQGRIITLRVIRDKKSESATGPIKLIWKIPTKFNTVKVPFEFKNLPLP